MKIKREGNILLISDKPYMRWAFGAIIFLFSLLLMFIGVSYLIVDKAFAVDLGIVISGLIFAYIGSRLVWKYPQIVSEIDKYTETLTYTKTSIFGVKKQIFNLKEIKKAEIANKDAFLDGESNDGKFRVEFVFRNGERLPVSSRWTISEDFCQNAADTINSTIPKLNQENGKKPELWKD